MPIFECFTHNIDWESLLCASTKLFRLLNIFKFQTGIDIKTRSFFSQCSNSAMVLRALQSQSLNFVPQDCSKVLRVASIVLWKENLTWKAILNTLLPGINSRSFWLISKLLLDKFWMFFYSEDFGTSTSHENSGFFMFNK